MPGKITNQSAIAGMYAIQGVYADRLKAFRQARHVEQGQKDNVRISQVAKELFESEKRIVSKKVPLTYSNPRVDNVAVKDTYRVEKVAS